MIVLDTTVLVYAVGSEHELRDPCRRLVESIASGGVAATTTVEVIQEFTHVRARRRGRADAAALAGSYADLLSPLLGPTVDDLRDGLRLFVASERLGAFDVVLAAAASSAGATALVSADAAFDGLTELSWVRPDAEGIDRLLAG